MDGYALIETKKDVITKESYTIQGNSIHSSILNGIIPVFTPVFIDIAGVALACTKVNIEMKSVRIHEISEKMLFILSTVIKVIKDMGHHYILQININEIESKEREVTDLLPHINIMVRSI